MKTAISRNHKAKISKIVYKFLRLTVLQVIDEVLLTLLTIQMEEPRQTETHSIHAEKRS